MENRQQLKLSEYPNALWYAELAEVLETVLFNRMQICSACPPFFTIPQRHRPQNALHAYACSVNNRLAHEIASVKTVLGDEYQVSASFLFPFATIDHHKGL